MQRRCLGLASFGYAFVSKSEQARRGPNQYEFPDGGGRAERKSYLL